MIEFFQKRNFYEIPRFILRIEFICVMRRRPTKKVWESSEVCGRTEIEPKEVTKDDRSLEVFFVFRFYGFFFYFFYRKTDFSSFLKKKEILKKRDLN